MGSYLKRFFFGHLLVLFVVATTGLYFGKSQLITVLAFAVLVECLFYYLDRTYLPKRRAEITKNVIEIFRAEPLEEGVLKFKTGAIDFFVKVEIDFKQGLQLANVETISFHIPKDQVRQLIAKPKLAFIEDQIGEIPTCNFYRTDGSGLKFAKKNIREMIK